MLPRHALDKMPIDISHMRPSTMTTRAYEESPRHVIGNIKIELVISPQPFQVTFQMMDIHPSYSMLLERLWIHTTGGLVTVKAKEAFSMINNMTISYIETEDNINGNLYAFKAMNAKWVP